MTGTPIALPALLLCTALSAQAQLNKCVSAGGQVTYSDRGCPSTAAASAIKAPPIAEPTRRDALAAQYRRIDESHRAEMAELRRQIAESRPLPGATSLGGSEPRGLGPIRPPESDSAKCAGIRYQQRRAKIDDPLGYDRTIHSHELARAEQKHCQN